MAEERRQKKQELTRLLEAMETFSGGCLCVHDFYGRTELDGKWLRHHGPLCTPLRNRDFPVCLAFCGQEIDSRIAGSPHGSIHTCPFGIWEAAVPINCDGILAGVLFGGSFPKPEDAAENTFRESTLSFLRCIAERMARIVEEPENGAQSVDDMRRSAILEWLGENLERSVALEELARRLHLSESRTGRVVVDLFGKSFTDLVQTARLNMASRWLREGRWNAGQIAQRLGYCDQAYFTRLFTRRFGTSPLRYRKDALARQLNT